MVKTTDHPTNVIVVYTSTFVSSLQNSQFNDVPYSTPTYTLKDLINPSNSRTFTADTDLVRFVTNGVIQYCNAIVVPKWSNPASKFTVQAILPNIDTLHNTDNSALWTTSQQDFNAIVIQNSSVTSLDNVIVIVLATTVDLQISDGVYGWLLATIDPSATGLGVHGNVGSTIFTWINFERAIANDALGSMQLCVGNQRNTVSLVMSHELAEIIANPWGTNLFYSGIPTVYYEKEIADPVQYNVIAMYVGGSGATGIGPGGFYMSMTDFVLANYFTTTSHTAPFCFGQILDIAKPTTSIPTLYMYLNLQWFPIDNVTIDKKAPKLTLLANNQHQDQPSTQSLQARRCQQTPKKS